VYRRIKDFREPRRTHGFQLKEKKKILENHYIVGTRIAVSGIGDTWRLMRQPDQNHRSRASRRLLVHGGYRCHTEHAPTGPWVRGHQVRRLLRPVNAQPSVERPSSLFMCCYWLLSVGLASSQAFYRRRSHSDKHTRSLFREITLTAASCRS
jgi:hypothetical protein